MAGNQRARWRGCWLLLAAAICLPWVPGARAHEIPVDVHVRVYLAVEQDSLVALIRVPLEAMRDVEFPLREQGYLDLERLDTELTDAAELWLSRDLVLYADGAPLKPMMVAARVALPGDGAFASFESARHAMSEERLPAKTALYWQQAQLDAEFRYPLANPDAELALDPRLARLGMRTTTDVRLVRPGEATARFVFVGDPGLVSLMPGSASVFRSFLVDGFRHVLGGVDHLLFLAALVLPVRRLRPLIVMVTAFTVAHSLTLAAAVFGLVPETLWFAPLVEMLIAATIVIMAFENILWPAVERRWLIAYGFGLVHGFGYAFALGSSLQLAGDHRFVSLAAFNIGIELGQLLVLLAALPVLRWLFDRLPPRPTAILLSALIAHTGWHWLLERYEVFSQYTVSLPVLDSDFLILALRWMLLLLVAALVVWLARPLVRAFSPAR